MMPQKILFSSSFLLLLPFKQRLLSKKKTNPCYPAQHSNIPNINWLQPAFPKSETRYPLEKGKELELNYELRLHESNDAAAKKAAWSEFQPK
jgi:hypothetical protein